MTTLTPCEWRNWYADERRSLGPAGLARLVEEAPDLVLLPGRSFIFPHTKLAESGRMVAAVAKAVVRAGHKSVLALGPLHGAEPDEPGEHPDPGDEFSLDGFCALVETAAEVLGRPAPAVIRRFPYIAWDGPDHLKGVDDLRRRVRDGLPVVATADWVHHGAGYGTPVPARRDPGEHGTSTWVHSRIHRALSHLARGRWAEFRGLNDEMMGDFRHAGPVLAHVLGAPERRLAGRVLDLSLVDYTEPLGAPLPTWVAAALCELGPAPPPRTKPHPGVPDDV